MTDSDVLTLASDLVERLFADDPISGSDLGQRRYDALLPDPSARAEDDLAADLVAFGRRAEATIATTAAERATLGVIRHVCASRQLSIANRAAEFTVSAMPLAGPPALLAIAAQTVLPDAQAAQDYLARVSISPAWLDGTTERLREGRAKGRLPVAALVDQAIAWADRTLATPVHPALVAPQAPEGWAGVREWRDRLEQVAADEVSPAIARWRELLVELRGGARDDDHAGVCALPDGAAEYERDIAVHTTLPLSADELHRIGMETIAGLADEARRLGSAIGLADLPSVIGAVRASAGELEPDTALAAAKHAVRRAEQRAAELMPDPLPGPCAVVAMPRTVAESGMAPHYTRPRPDGSRPGTYWFNTLRPTAGAGWDLEAVAFHETVPGHHSQLARLQLLPELPLVQQRGLTVHAEGWGLYAEQLAGEIGLYADERAQLGAVYMSMHRAARLVVDTGLHAFGWSRTRAIRFMLDHVALPEAFLINEVDRYIAWPGQALAYLTGQREILRLRDEARDRLGTAFDLPSFHAALLDNGSLPMPVLAGVVDDWVATRQDGAR